MDFTTTAPFHPSTGTDQLRLFAGERRAFPRLHIDLRGVCSVAGRPDVSCVARDISVGGMSLLCDDRAAAVDTEVVVSLPQVGLLRGRVVRLCPDGFAMTFAEGRVQRESVSNFLTWLIERETDSGFEDRLHARIVPLRRLVSLVAAAESSMARIIDISRSGVALMSMTKVQIGDEIVLGSRPAVVVRMLEGGFAAQFAEPLGPDLDTSIVL